MPRQPTIRLSPGQLLRYPFDRSLRRAHRQFKGFPNIPYRQILDIGAHDGSFTTAAIRLLSPEQIWLVEADPQLVDRLRERFRHDSRCHVVHAAIADKSGEVKLRLNRHRASSSILPISGHTGQAFGQDMSETESIPVPALSLDDLFAREKISEIDLCKVDIQGAERLLIEGGTEALRRIRLLHMEVLFDEFWEGCAQFSEIHALLKARGFKLHVLDGFRKSTSGDVAYANALYRNSSFFGS
jgi:FkbM family methyltransferase